MVKNDLISSWKTVNYSWTEKIYISLNLRGSGFTKRKSFSAYSKACFDEKCTDNAVKIQVISLDVIYILLHQSILIKGICTKLHSLIVMKQILAPETRNRENNVYVRWEGRC